MSWDADIFDEHGRPVHWGWNYTHNTTGMIWEALKAAGIEGPDGSFWLMVDGKTSAEVRPLLAAILGQFDADPDRYRKLNPDNGWGDFDSFRDVLREMHDAAKVDTDRWAVSW